jgi:hypothetical protein
MIGARLDIFGMLQGIGTVFFAGLADALRIHQEECNQAYEEHEPSSFVDKGHSSAMAGVKKMGSSDKEGSRHWERKERKEKKGGRKTKFLVMSLYLLFKRAPSNMTFY